MPFHSSVKRHVVLFMLLVLSQFCRAAPEMSFVGGCPPERSASLAAKGDLVSSAITYCDGGDAAVGTVALAFPAKSLKKMDFYSAGYLNGTTVKIELVNAAGEAVLLTPQGTGDQWRRLKFSLPKTWSKSEPVRLVLTDESSAWTGWAGIGYAKHEVWAFNASKYLLFFLKAVLVTLILFLPGLWLRATGRVPMPVAFLPLPGMIACALAGIGVWAGPAELLWYGKLVFFGACIFMLVDWVRRRVGRGRSPARDAAARAESGDEKHLAVVFVLVFLQALFTGVNPLPVAQELGTENSMPGRMVASPPDHVIPYQTADYFFNQYDGKERSKDYFGDWNVGSRGPLVPLGIAALFEAFNFGDWNVVSRGPLVPLGITTLFEAFKLSPQGMNKPRNEAQWPIATGEDIARIYGWLLNACVILGAFQLMGALGMTGSPRRMALVWVALSPVVIINTVFLWPKLLAVYFILMALAAVLQRRAALAGALMALAWLSHPVGALMLPSVSLFLILACRAPGDETDFSLRDGVSYLRGYLPFVVGLAGLMAPWLAYKAWLGYSDVFLAYVLGGGNGVEKAASWQQWLAVRASNVWLTLAPGAFYLSEYMQAWVHGPLRDALRWTVQSAKTLPGNIGFSCFLVAYLAFLRRPAQPALRALRTWVLGAGFLAMIVFWGFSGDGLGRNSLEPLSVLVMLFAVASWSPAARWLRWTLPLLALESGWLILSGFVLEKNFDGDLMPTEALLLLGGNLLVLGLLVASIPWRARGARAAGGLAAPPPVPAPSTG
jgi:hypothetical protein